MKKVDIYLMMALMWMTNSIAQTSNHYVNLEAQGNYNDFFSETSGQVNTVKSNTFLDSYADHQITWPDINVFFGLKSGIYNTSGEHNVFMGCFTGYSNSTGSKNLFSGFYAGKNNTTGSRNVCLGAYSGYKNITGQNNIFNGYAAGHSNTTGSNNVIIGVYAGGNNKSGNDNVFHGKNSGNYNITGIQNTYLGSHTGYTSKGTGNVFIGYRSGYHETGSDKLYIDNSETTTPLLYGDFATHQLGINTNTIPKGYAIAVNGKLLTDEINVKVNSWSDFVFEKNYELLTLEEVEKHIQKNGHLQDIPPAKEVALNGINLGEMDAKLLQKIEELTLYAIEQKKKLEAQKKVNQQLEERLNKIELLIKK